MSERAGIFQELLSECDQLLGGLRADLPGLRDLRPKRGLLKRMHRAAHTVKGLTGFLALPGVTDAAARLAERLRGLRDDSATLTLDAVAELDSLLTGLLDMLSGLRGPSRITHAPLPAVLANAPAPGTPDEAAPAALISELSRSVLRTLSSFGARRVKCREVVQRRLSRSSAALTIAIDLELDSESEREGPSARAVVFEFEAKTARALAETLTTSTLAEPISGPPEEQVEFVEGALGDMANRAVSEMMLAAGTPFRVSGPYFYRGAGEQMCTQPQRFFCFNVESDLGSFEAGILAGAVFLEGEGVNRTERGPSGRPRSVLVVHHSAVMRKMLRRTFQGTSYEVVAEARDGRRAVETFRTVRPELVVLALNMPGMGGLDALRIIRADDPGAKVLICSAVAEGGAIRQSLRAGAVGYVTTPFEPAQFVRTVESLFQTSRPPQNTVAAALGLPALGIYRVMDFLAEGGMADVYKGYDPGLGREVALKVMKDKFAGDVEFVVRFLNEARAVASINHPNVVSVYFAGSDGGKHFFAMEFLPGPDLEYLVARDNVVLSEYEALEYIIQAAGGLAAADRRGIVHCDIKPSNLVLGADALLKVTDFGIARHVRASSGRVDSGPYGTPAYASPEQAMGGQVDLRSDIYALGATLYFLVAGTPPYDGSDEMEAVLRHIHDPVPRLKGASRRVNKLLARMMAKSPHARHTTYEELITDINRIV